jgi:hypothetical protein
LPSGRKSGQRWEPYTVSSDGKKFVMNTVLPQSTAEPLTLITNWPVDLKQ